MLTTSSWCVAGNAKCEHRQMTNCERTSDWESEAREAIDLYRHYMSIRADDLLAEYASAKVRDNREATRMAAIEEAFDDRYDEMDDLMLVVQER